LPRHTISTFFRAEERRKGEVRAIVDFEEQLSDRRGPKFLGDTNTEKGGKMRLLTMTVILALPLMALGQTTEPQQTQGQTKETQATAPAKGKKMPPRERAEQPTGKT
jgi:hypothetical protein